MFRACGLLVVVVALVAGLGFAEDRFRSPPLPVDVNHDGVLDLVTWSGRVNQAIDGRTGAQLWSRPHTFNDVVAVAGDSVIVSHETGVLEVAELSTNRPRWSSKVADEYAKRFCVQGDRLNVDFGGSAGCYLLSNGKSCPPEPKGSPACFEPMNTKHSTNLGSRSIENRSGRGIPRCVVSDTPPAKRSDVEYWFDGLSITQRTFKTESVTGWSVPLTKKTMVLAEDPIDGCSLALLTERSLCYPIDRKDDVPWVSCIDRQTGKLQWEHEVVTSRRTGRISGMRAVDGALVLKVDEGEAFIYSVADGRGGSFPLASQRLDGGSPP